MAALSGGHCQPDGGRQARGPGRAGRGLRPRPWAASGQGGRRERAGVLSVARGGERVGRAGLKGALTVNTTVKLLPGAKHCAEHFPPIDVAERPGNTWGWALSFCRRGN